MSEDGSEISKLKERLSMTGSKLADISKKAAEATKTAAVKTAELSKDAAQSAGIERLRPHLAFQMRCSKKLYSLPIEAISK